MSSLKTPQVLELDPPTELIFRGPFNEIVTTSLKLTNPTNEKVGFKVKTTAPKQYCVRPNSGIIESHDEQQVSVMLQPLEDIPLADRMKHKFMVQSMCVDDSISPDILDDAMRKADKKKLMDSKLKCSFVEEDIAEQPSSSKADTISASSFESSEHVLAPDNKSSEASLDNTPVTTITPSEQPTAGSTPGHNTGREGNLESEHVESELRLLRDRAKKLNEENKTLKTETDRLRQQFLTQSTTVNKPNRVATPPSSNFAVTPFNAFALLLIFIALVMGYIIGSSSSA
ncbi:PREDICTED: vesicle-associated membrane protein-associated protein B/C-like isoform X2 [Amphimedon queenslandica]|uniref:MSP domain-containing protein n=1 Tax=Amphimedon queenslandica TaxID=400682 RepID=A0AAN0IBV7_AMPQE|nr:PREDICTED: vesicle-associated membrane protein-associated protein B/C-like isoform X2 [Amphimedon queenslandica]|eukprot:XP_003384603.1 PREDICTED: vesicle-associated membrane protein-associated protein B/C-like isoform X2 [Amphimedon queenslandica]